MATGSSYRKNRFGFWRCCSKDLGSSCLVGRYSSAFGTFLAALVLCSCADDAPRKVEPNRPNFVYILADDLGFGDVRAYNPESKIPTPHIDQLASEGMRFTDAHSPLSVCTPTRYALLTGRYSWRSRLTSGVLWSYGRSLIEPDRPTVASMLKEQGYATAVIGKWHLGHRLEAQRAASKRHRHGSGEAAVPAQPRRWLRARCSPRSNIAASFTARSRADRRQRVGRNPLASARTP